MSTLPGVASKGEKGKSKYQSLDINNLYRLHTSEPSEAQQPKNTLPRKHGMQSLGKVPTARRPPANLPSLKSEHTGSDAAVSLVPSGGSGWGKQEPHSPSSTTPPMVTSVPNSNTTSPISANVQVNIQPATAVPVPTITPPIKHHHTPTATPVTTDKSWSSIMSGTDIFQPPPYQSPQFQHEFPSLSAGEGIPRIGVDTQYGPGPSLRPQTEGSWIQGGTRPGPETVSKGNSGQLGPTPQLLGQGGHINQQQQSLPPQYRGVMPPFMYRGNFTPNGPVGPNLTGIPGSVNNGRNPVIDNRTGLRRPETEEVLHRPIIKEEELNRMDDMIRDVGWATHDDIDYNQKLAFSDEESEMGKNSRKGFNSKEQDKTEHNLHEAINKSNWGGTVKSGSNAQLTVLQGNKNRSNEDDEVWVQRRRQQSEEVAIAVERAKQRKEEEEKRFLETKQAAAKKLQKLEEKINKTKLDKEIEDSQGTINPSVVPHQPITPVPIPVPEWEKEKDIRTRSSGMDLLTNKLQYRDSSDFRKLTQIEARGFIRKETRSTERDTRDREQSGPSFSKQFQSNLPPRFLKQLRSNTSSAQSPPTSSGNNMFNDQYESNWQQGQVFNKNSINSHKIQHEVVVDEQEVRLENESKDIIFNLDDKYRGSHNSYLNTNILELKPEKNQDNRIDDSVSQKEIKKDEKLENEVQIETKNLQQNVFDDHVSYHVNDKAKTEEKFQDRYERPQRPDSRDSRTSRDSRHSRDSEPRDHHSTWTDSSYEPSYDERRRELHKEDRRPVPGPITRDRIEADDLKSEKKNLTQLKRGYIPEKRPSNVKKNLEVIEKVEDDGWTIPKNRDIISNEIKTSSDMQQLSFSTSDNTASLETEKSKSTVGEVKLEEKYVEHDNKKYDKERRPGSSGRYNDSRLTPWGGGGYVYPRTWSKRNESSRRGGRNGVPRKCLNKGGESHGTDSDVSADDMSSLYVKKCEKEEKNKEVKQEKPVTNTERKSDFNNRKDNNYLPRGEPSRHGRGAGNFRNRGGGLGKRIDGYGPPPSKSPFSQIDDKKTVNDEITPSDTVISSDEKIKQNQQALSAGIIGSNRNGTSKDSISSQQLEEAFDNKGTNNVANAQNPKKETRSVDNWDTSENSDECGVKDQTLASKFNNSKSSSDRLSANMRRSNQPPRFSNEKRNYNSGMRQNSNGPLKSGSGKPIDDNFKTKNKSSLELKIVTESDTVEKVCDSDGFQEVKSKKTGPRQKLNEEKPITKSVVKSDKPLERKKSNGPVPPLTPEQIASLPSLMDTPINPPPIVPNINNKNAYDRSRQNTLPPRFAKQRENSRLQKAQIQQGICDLNDKNKVNHNLNMYGVKDTQNTVSSRIGNAWEKPLSTHIRNEQEVLLTVNMDVIKSVEQPQQSTSPSTDKVIKTNHIGEKSVLDGATPPVNTIIFENTNFKTAPGSRSSRSDKSITNESVIIDQAVMSSFSKPVIRDLLNKNEKQSEPIDMNDMKLDFFETEISHLTDDKGPKNLALSRSMHSITNASNTLSASTTDALNFKIASVKRVWENAPSGIEHAVGQEDSNSSFSASFGSDSNTLDPSAAFAKSSETTDESHEAYTSPNQNTSSSTTNICKVKPTQQISSGGQTVHVGGSHPQHSAVVGPGIVGHPLSPPPMPPVLGGGVGIGQPPQQFTSNQHIGFQPTLAASNQYGMSAIPSPPTVLFNSTPQLQAAQTAAGLYGTFQLDQAQVLSSQGRTQFSQYPYGLGQTASSPYSTQSVYLQGAQPHPPTAQPPPDLYQNMNNYRLSTTGPFGQGQQLTNPSTVLISSTSNSLMSASVKPATQQISAIGTKTNGAGQAYQQQSQQGQLYMTYDPALQANYLPSTGVMQRPTAPLQSNVVPALQASSSYYSGSAGGQTSFFQQPTNSTLQSAQLSHTGYSLQANVFGNHNQSHASAGLQNFGSHFLSPSMQLAAAAALTAQQYRSSNLQSSPYLKSVSIGEQGTRPQQIKSPSSQQDVLSSVFTSGPQIPSPKSRQNMKQSVSQPSPTTQLKYNLYATVGNPQQASRYPAPIQRPVAFQTALGAMQGNTGSSNNYKHRSGGQNKLSGRNYYGQGNNLSSSHHDKVEDSKLGDTATSNSSNTPTVSSTTSIVTKAIITTNSTITVNQTTEIKETSTKDEAGVVKD